MFDVSKPWQQPSRLRHLTAYPETRQRNGTGQKILGQILNDCRFNPFFCPKIFGPFIPSHPSFRAFAISSFRDSLFPVYFLAQRVIRVQSVFHPWLKTYHFSHVFPKIPRIFALTRRHPRSSILDPPIVPPWLSYSKQKKARREGRRGTPAVRGETPRTRRGTATTPRRAALFHACPNAEGRSSRPPKRNGNEVSHCARSDSGQKTMPIRIIPHNNYFVNTILTHFHSFFSKKKALPRPDGVANLARDWGRAGSSPRHGSTRKCRAGTSPCRGPSSHKQKI